MSSEEHVANAGSVSRTPKTILLVEDSPGDIRLTREALRDTASVIHLHVVRDGIEAMSFLQHGKRHARAPRPHLILLDLNLPKMNGREVLAQIKADDSLRKIPTIILTTSESEADIDQAYHLNANCYLTKAVQWDAFHRLVRSTTDYWLNSVTLPAQRQG
jgi:chemotaxis family two-component system response regulator Rcp1